MLILILGSSLSKLSIASLNSLSTPSKLSCLTSFSIFFLDDFVSPFILSRLAMIDYRCYLVQLIQSRAFYCYCSIALMKDSEDSLKILSMVAMITSRNFLNSYFICLEILRLKAVMRLSTLNNWLSASAQSQSTSPSTWILESVLAQSACFSFLSIEPFVLAPLSTIEISVAKGASSPSSSCLCFCGNSDLLVSFGLLGVSKL